MADSPVLYVYYRPDNDDAYPGVPNRHITEADWARFSPSQRRTVEHATTQDGYTRRKVWLHRDLVDETEQERADREAAEQAAREAYERGQSLVRYREFEKVLPGPGEVIVGTASGPVARDVSEIGVGDVLSTRERTLAADLIGQNLASRPDGVIGFDTFNRPDTADTLGISTSGNEWWASSSFRLVDHAAVVKSGTLVFPFIRNIHKPDEIELVVDTPEAGLFEFGVVWRANTHTDMLYLSCQSEWDSFRLMRVTSGTHTALATKNAFGWQNGRRYTFLIRDIGDQVSVTVNGVEEIPATTIGGDPMTGTELGLAAHGVKDSGTRFQRLTWRRTVSPARRAFPLNIAHMARTSGMPENSVVSLRHLPGTIDGIEIDTYQTADGVWVCMHDLTVDRTTNGTGTTTELPSSYVRSLTINGGGGPVPTLVEMLDAAHAKGMREIHLDVGAGDWADLVALVEAHPMADRCVFFMGSASDAGVLRGLSSTARIAVGSVTAANATAQIAAAVTHGVELVYLAPGDAAYTANRAVVAQIKAAGMKAGASSVNTSPVIRQASADGVDVLLTDFGAMVNV